MPKVGSKDFAYTDKGMKEAEKYAKETNQEMEMYYAGGIVNAFDRVKKYKEGGKVNIKENK